MLVNLEMQDEDTFVDVLKATWEGEELADVFRYLGRTFDE